MDYEERRDGAFEDVARDGVLQPLHQRRAASRRILHPLPANFARVLHHSLMLEVP